jgi:hypothetical protein
MVSSVVFHLPTPPIRIDSTECLKLTHFAFFAKFAALAGVPFRRMVAFVPVEPVAKSRRMQKQLTCCIAVALNNKIWEANFG